MCGTLGGERRGSQNPELCVNGSVVVDATLAVKWLVEEDDSDKAHATLQSWVAQDITRIAPHLMPSVQIPSVVRSRM